MKKIILTILPLMFILISTLSVAVYADEPTDKGYTPLATLPVISGQDTSKGDLAPYLVTLYQVGIWTAVILAIASIIWGGVQYITSVGGEGKSSGKEMIQSALFGLLLALGSYIILKTINQDLLNLDFTISEQK